jgi:hypothetical protein
MVPAVTHQPALDGGYRDPLEVAQEKILWILEEYQPEPLEAGKQMELTRLLDAADREIGGHSGKTGLHE